MCLDPLRIREIEHQWKIYRFKEQLMKYHLEFKEFIDEAEQAIGRVKGLSAARLKNTSYHQIGDLDLDVCLQYLVNRIKQLGFKVVQYYIYRYATYTIQDSLLVTLVSMIRTICFHLMKDFYASKVVLEITLDDTIIMLEITFQNERIEYTAEDLAYLAQNVSDLSNNLGDCSLYHTTKRICFTQTIPLEQ